MRIARTAAAILLILLISFTATAVDYLKSDLTDSPGVRAAGMGGAFAAVADDYAAFFWNPAGLVQIERFSCLTFDYDFIYSNSQNEASLNYYQNFMNGIAASASFMHLASTPSYYSPDYFTTDLYYITGSTYLDDRRQLSVGANLKLINVYARDISVSGQAYTADFGVLYRPEYWGRKLSFGAMLQDIDGWINWSNSVQTEIPFTLKIGACYRIDKTLPIALDLDITHYGIGDTGYDRRSVHFGAEKWFLDTVIGNFAVRAGFMWQEAQQYPFTPAAGVSYSRKDFDINYSYLPNMGFGGDTHRVSVTYFFGEYKQPQ